jgi:hypothetical protein
VEHPPGCLSPRWSNPAAAYKHGVLEAVTDYGIVGEFADMRIEESGTMRRFYPWSAVLSITPIS